MFKRESRRATRYLTLVKKGNFFMTEFCLCEEVKLRECIVDVACMQVCDSKLEL